MDSEKSKGTPSPTPHDTEPQQMTLFPEEKSVVIVERVKINALLNAFNHKSANSTLKVEHIG